MAKVNNVPVIYLVGARGSGKTTIGAKLAIMRQIPFLDMDSYLCDGEGKSVRDIVRECGWPGFREKEARYLKQATEEVGHTGAVIATGGGVVLLEENRAFLRANGLVFWLRAGADTLGDRIARNPLAAQRPALTASPPREEIRQVLMEREALYRECAHHVIDAEKSFGHICNTILAAIPQPKTGSP